MGGARRGVARTGGGAVRLGGAARCCTGSRRRGRRQLWRGASGTPGLETRKKIYGEEEGSEAVLGGGLVTCWSTWGRPASSWKFYGFSIFFLLFVCGSHQRWPLQVGSWWLGGDGRRFVEAEGRWWLHSGWSMLEEKRFSGLWCLWVFCVGCLLEFDC